MRGATGWYYGDIIGGIAWIGVMARILSWNGIWATNRYDTLLMDHLIKCDSFIDHPHSLMLFTQRYDTVWLIGMVIAHMTMLPLHEAV
jgi:hypothetical protein